MFSRVQMGVTLSSAEKLAAHLGPWPEFLRMLIKRYLDPVPGLSTDQFGNTIITVNRGKDYLFMAQITLLIHHAHVSRPCTDCSSHLSLTIKYPYLSIR